MPKGKQNPDEYLAVTARREVREETGCDIRLVTPLPNTQYTLSNRVKEVHWWLAELRGDEQLPHDDETDRVEWWPIDEAIARLSISNDVDTLVAALRQSTRSHLLVIRHAKAMPRKSWKSVDADRRLTERGRRQSKALIGLLDAFGVCELYSSTSTRCMKTLTPYGDASGIEVHGYAELSEESFEENPKGVAKAMKKIVAAAKKSSRPVAVCGHRPVLPTMTHYLGIDVAHTLHVGEVIVVGFDGEGDVTHTSFIVSPL